jgi:DNA primase
MYIPEEKIAEIKNTADIFDVVSELVLLKKTGKNYVGLCPFHSEKTPSFTVSPEKQIFHCFGCGTGGNVFSFLMQQEGFSFPEAARNLARRYGIDIPAQRMSPEQKRRYSEKENLLGINRTAMDYFHQALLSGATGKAAMAYLKKRGFSQETIEAFNLGYAPEGWDNLTNLFLKKRISPALAEKAGVIVPKKNRSGFYDRFRNRVIFPIFDANRRPVGFGGRVMDDSMPKYLNSPETPLYNKGRSLYGIHRAKLPCRKHNTVYIVEGYFDLLALHQHGIENAVATLGTALTPEHVRLLKGYAARMVMVYDSDEAGIKAVVRSIETFKTEEVDARIIVLPEGYDPDSFIMKFGYASFMKVSDRAKAIMSFLIDAAVNRHGLSNEGKIRIVQDLKGPLGAVSDKVARSLYIKELAERIGIDEDVVQEKVREASIRGKAGPGLVREKVNLRKWDRLERQIITMMLQFPEILPDIEKRRVLDLFENDDLKSIGKLVLAHTETSPSRVSDIMSLCRDDKKRRLIAHLSIGEDLWTRDGCQGIIARFEYIRRKNEKTLLEKIKLAEENNDVEQLKVLLAEKQKKAELSDKQKRTLLK